MKRISERLNCKTTPLANEKAIIKGDKYRFTILTDRLIRIEYDKEGKFTDKATESVVNRNFDVPKFSVEKTGDYLKVSTKYVTFTYNYGEFKRNTLHFEFCGPYSCRRDWRFGDASQAFMGTGRTLDGYDGDTKVATGEKVKLTPSIVSDTQFAIMDDSSTIVLGEDGWMEERPNEVIDMYIFGYKEDFQGAIDAYHTLTGKNPLLPRFALGNWWSRYHKYTEEEYTKLMLDFEKIKVPLSVAVIDMDWHLVDIDAKYGSGWTGYTWNREFFPDPARFLKWLNNRDMKVTLNLHPAEGVASHEDAYEEIATRMGIDPKTEKKVDFDIANPDFLEPYLECLHHKNEEDGVTFWWMDWQQGKTTKMPSLDPLWALNHYHYIDNTRKGNRGLILSRFSGYGSQRYPIGFSGDTCISWNSLQYQTKFTVAAANLGYDWWSHDIGGHHQGKKDNELTARWVQFGTFSPINRMHSTDSPFLGREPWNYSDETAKIITEYMQLRYKLIPYTYTMNYLTHTKNYAIMRPTYFVHPNDRNCYDGEYKDEYYFGTELLVKPVTHKINTETLMATENVYLPCGIWFDYFTHTLYNGKRNTKMHRTISSIPVFAKGGAIVPTSYINEERINDVSNPEKLKIEVFAGADNTFEMYEDDGISFDYKDGKFAITKFDLNWNKKSFKVQPTGDLSVIPQKRTFNFEFIRFSDCDVKVLVDKKEIKADKVYENDTIKLSIECENKEIEIVFEKCEIVKNDTDKMIFDFLLMAQMGNREKDKLYRNTTGNKTVCEKISEIMEFTKVSPLSEPISWEIKDVLIEYIISDN